MKKSGTVARPIAVESPRYLPLVDLLVDARTELFELAIRSGLKVLERMLEEDRTAMCDPRYAHATDRQASRAGTVSSEVVLGGRKVAVRRPRVRAEGREVPLPTFQAMADDDPLNRRESGARAGDDEKSGDEQERGKSSLRGEDRGPTVRVADRRPKRSCDEPTRPPR